jgi:hypothetical protein
VELMSHLGMKPRTIGIGASRQNGDVGLEAVLRRLDRFDAVILDDLGYVQQSRLYYGR